MMRTRQLHARLAYVMRVDKCASLACAAASARSVRCGLLSPEVLMRSGCASQAWLTLCAIRSARGLTWCEQGDCTHAYARAWEMSSAHANPSKNTYSPQASVLAERKNVLQSLATRCIATRLTKELLHKKRSSSPMHL